MTVQEFWTAWSAIAATVLAAVALIAAAIGLRQIAEMARARQADILIWIFRELDRLRGDRRVLFNRFPRCPSPDFDTIDTELLRAADDVAASFDYLGLLVREKLVRKEPAIELCLSPVINSWELLEEYVDYRRSLRGEYWSRFEELYIEAKNLQKKRGTKVTRWGKEGEGHPADPKGRDHG